jgi:ribonuclease HI
MELAAAIVGVRAALDAGASHVTVVSDSEYVVKGMTRWLSGWLAKGWRTSDGQPVKNRELWEQLAELAERGTLQWQWIRGHAGHSENERCDAVATAAARKAAIAP